MSYVITDNNPASLEEIWRHILDQLEPGLRKEASAKGYKLKLHPDIREDSISKTFLITVPDASAPLSLALQTVGDVVSLIKD